MIRPQRPSADKTRHKILQAARFLFLKQGFEGVSMQEIADLAEVNQNLLFHHFQNKQTLWLKVKEAIIANSQLTFKPDVSNLYNFIKGIVQYKFALYEENPDLERFLKWQQLEANKSNDQLINLNWLSSVVYLQKRSLIDATLDPKVVVLFLLATINGLFMYNSAVLSPLQKKGYQELIIKSCLQGIIAK
ncbi:MAG: hypothetical protein A3E87_02830 [Gammaproteobacteria bacterium RIFCSPHIGHO2_12_FULL_35_23]|nr:MAG: hypothetical protein A3E87_02830 [Gammaproteobacteria bacterium RIFCSPHIGHO2_12_FULL_35_23]